MELNGTGDIQFIKEIIVPLLTPEEAISFTVRDGVTFRDYEILLGERVFAIDGASFKRRRLSGVADVYLRDRLGDLRNKRTIHKCPTCQLPDEVYRPKDLLRELHWHLGNIMTVAGQKYDGPPDSVQELHEDIADMEAYLRSSVLEKEKFNMALESPVDTLCIRSRMINDLKRGGIKTIRDLVSKTQEELVQIEGINRGSISMIRDELERKGFHFAAQESK